MFGFATDQDPLGTDQGWWFGDEVDGAMGTFTLGAVCAMCQACRGQHLEIVRYLAAERRCPQAICTLH